MTILNAIQFSLAHCQWIFQLPTEDGKPRCETERWVSQVPLIDKPYTVPVHKMCTSPRTQLVLNFKTPNTEIQVSESVLERFNQLEHCPPHTHSQVPDTQMSLQVVYSRTIVHRIESKYSLGIHFTQPLGCALIWLISLKFHNSQLDDVTARSWASLLLLSL